MCLFPGQLVGECNEPIRHGSIGSSQSETGSLVVRACGSCLQYAEVPLNVDMAQLLFTTYSWLISFL